MVQGLQGLRHLFQPTEALVRRAASGSSQASQSEPAGRHLLDQILMAALGEVSITPGAPGDWHRAGARRSQARPGQTATAGSGSVIGWRGRAGVEAGQHFVVAPLHRPERGLGDRQCHRRVEAPRRAGWSRACRSRGLVGPGRGSA